MKMEISPEQQRALTLPSRRRILEFFMEQPEPLSSEDLAEQLEEKPELITYHLRVLDKSGLLQSDGATWSLQLEPDEVRAMLDQVKPLRG